MTEPDNPPAQTTTQECITFSEPVRIAVENAGEGPVKHSDCPAPNGR